MSLQFFDEAFRRINERSCDFIRSLPPELLFLRPTDSLSCGEYILRSAAAVEQTFGGITTRLWDDPFEWTLPEELSTPEKILDYLREIENTRQRGFAYFVSDNDLSKKIPAPEKLKTISELLHDTIERAEQFQNKAREVLKLLRSE